MFWYWETVKNVWIHKSAHKSLLNLSSWCLLLTIVMTGELLRCADSEDQLALKIWGGLLANWRLKGPLHQLCSHCITDQTRAPSNHRVIFRSKRPGFKRLVVTDLCLVESSEERHVCDRIPSKCVKDINPTEQKVIFLVPYYKSTC